MCWFFHDHLDENFLTLSAEESRHCVKTLRRKEGDLITITDGKGKVVTAQLLNRDKEACSVQVMKREEKSRERAVFLHIGIAMTKNSDRMEWFVEKATEIGIEKISFLQCEHGERSRIDLARMERIAIAAIKQSQTTRLPEMEIIALSDFYQKYKNDKTDKYIAWCDSTNETQFSTLIFNQKKVILLIGPEGDFSSQEIQQATELGFIAVKLGEKRLRTETAGLFGTVAVASRLLF